VARACKKLSVCPKYGCGRWHHPLLHEDSSVSAIGSTSCRPSVGNGVMLGCVPVRLVGPSGSVDTYCFLDNGSDTTLVNRELAEKLGLPLNTCNLNVDTVHGKKLYPVIRQNVMFSR
jgi:hypothetical protein